MIGKQMGNRDYSEYAEQLDLKDLVDSLADPGLSTDKYRETMTRLGNGLARSVLDEVGCSTNDIFVVCTVEDADYLAKGVIEKLEEAGFGSRTKLLCIWNGKVRDEGVSLSPILRQYKEPSSSSLATVIVVKSIISGACVVKTNLTRALSDINPESIFVVAPVIYEGAQTRLESEFPREVSTKFKYRWIATDREKKDELVIPGVGGSVYERLGFEDERQKNRSTPAIVKRRRKEHSFSAAA